MVAASLRGGVGKYSFILVLLIGRPLEPGKNKNRRARAVISIAQQRNKRAGDAINSGRCSGSFRFRAKQNCYSLLKICSYN